MLITCIRWKKKDKYKPWEAKSRIETFWQLIRTSYLSITKSIGINKKIYLLKPVLSDEEKVCGEDFDATWLTNWFDTENILKKLDFSIERVFPQNFDSKIIRLMKALKLPDALQFFYIRVRMPCVIVGTKK